MLSPSLHMNRVSQYKGLRIFSICSKTVVGHTFNNCWFLVYKWPVMEKQVTSSYKWLPVFTFLTTSRMGTSH